MFVVAIAKAYYLSSVFTKLYEEKLQLFTVGLTI